MLSRVTLSLTCPGETMSRKRKHTQRRGSPDYNTGGVPETPSFPQSPSTMPLFIQAHEATIIRDRPDLVQALTAHDPGGGKGKGSLIQWHGEEQPDEQEVWVDRYASALVNSARISFLPVEAHRRIRVLFWLYKPACVHIHLLPSLACIIGKVFWIIQVTDFYCGFSLSLIRTFTPTSYRYDARLLLTSLPTASCSSDLPTTTSPPSPTGWSDLPSDSEDTFFFSPKEIEDLQREKRRKLIDSGRETRLRAMREADPDPARDFIEAKELWGGDDEEASREVDFNYIIIH